MSEKPGTYSGYFSKTTQTCTPIIYTSTLHAHMFLAAVSSQIMVCSSSVRVKLITHTIQGFEGHPLRKDFPLTVRIFKFDLAIC